MSQNLSSRNSVIIGTGSALPPRVVSNDELATQLETSNEWIVERSGISERRIAAEGVKTSDLATEAATAALAKAGKTAADIDLVIVATATPDDTFPSTATRVQARLGICQGAAFDVAAVCSGFVYAVSVADAMLKSGNFNCALVIGAELFSRILDWEDRTTAVLFGDGAGAIVLESQTNTDRGILATRLHADGKHGDLLYVDGGPGTTGTVGKLRMKGRDVFRHAVTNLASVAEEVLEQAELPASALDWIVPHQANARIIEATAKKLNMPMERVVMTVGRHANTSAASVPLALDTAVSDGRIKQGDLCLLEAMGGGFTWGAALVRF